jgi:hypothetical protein
MYSSAGTQKQTLTPLLLLVPVHQAGSQTSTQYISILPQNSSHKQLGLSFEQQGLHQCIQFPLEHLSEESK